MALRLTLPLLLLCVFQGAQCLPSNAEVLAELQELKAASDTHIIFVTNMKQYNRLVVQPSSYEGMVLFTASNPAVGCTICDEFLTDIKAIAYSYEAALENDKGMPVFFLVVDFSESSNQPIFQKHKFSQVPVLIARHPEGFKESARNIYVVPKQDIFETGMGEMYSQRLIDYINRQTKKNVQLRAYPMQILINFVVTVTVLGLTVWLGYRFFWFLKHPVTMTVISLLFYWVCTSGVMYNIIHGVPFVNVGQKGQMQFIASGQRSQYAGEGFFMGFTILLGGLGLAGLSQLRRGAGRRSFILGLLGMACMLFSWIVVGKIYSYKAEWYNPPFWPWGYYVQGPLREDQGFTV